MPLWAVHRPTAFPDTLDASLSSHTALAPYFPLLDSQSVIKIQKFRLLVDAQRCLLGRLLTRFLISTRFGMLWNSIQIKYTPAGRPYYEAPGAIDFDFNLSHDGDWVVLAWSDTGINTVGVDVMQIKLPWDGATLEDFIEGLNPQFSYRELAEIDALPHEDRLRRVYALWTVKEAYTKALGIGLGLDFSRIDVQLDATSSSVAAVCDDGVELHGWSFALLELEGNYLVAIASSVAAFDSRTVKSVLLEEMVAASARGIEAT